MLQLKKPIAMSFTFVERKDGLCDFVYNETCAEDDVTLMVATVKMTPPDFPIKLSKDERTATIERKGISRKEVFDMLTGEFIMNSSFADITIPQLLVMVAMMGDKLAGMQKAKKVQ